MEVGSPSGPKSAGLEGFSISGESPEGPHPAKAARRAAMRVESGFCAA
jgi:hypothetical protein